MMFCPHCGTQIADGSLFCAACGLRIETGAGDPPAGEQTQTNQQAQPYDQSQSYQQPDPYGQPQLLNEFSYPNETSNETTVLSDLTPPAFATPQFDAPEQKKQKKPKKAGSRSKKIIIGAISGVVAAALVLTVVLNFQKIRGAFISTFGSDEAYFEYVEEKEAQTYAQAISSVYAAPLNFFRLSSAGTTTLSFRADQKVLEAFLQQMGINYTGDLSFLEEFQFETKYNFTENGVFVGFGLLASGQKLLSTEVTADFANGMLYFAFPELTNKTLTLQLPELPEMESMGSDFRQAAALLQEVGEILPSEEEMAKLLERYIGVVIGAVDTLEVEKETLQISGISQSCKTITANISQQTIADIAIAVLREVKNDNDLRGIVRRLQTSELLKSAVGESEIAEIVEGYDFFLAQIDGIIKELTAQKMPTDTICTIIDYVNGDHEVIGRKLVVGGEPVFSYATVQDGKKFASKVEVSGETILKGSGTKSGGKTTGEYVITFEGHEFVRLLLTDFDFKSLQKGYLNGSVRIVPGEEMLSELFGSVIATILKPSLEFKFETSEKASNVDVNLWMDNSVMVGMSIGSTVSDEEKLTIPSGDLVDINDSSAPAEFLGSLNFDKVRNSLRNAKLPQELLAYAEQLIDMLENGMMGSAGSFAPPIYDYDYDYDYGDYTDYDFGF